RSRAPARPTTTRSRGCSAKSVPCDSSSWRRRVSSASCSGVDAMGMFDFLKTKKNTASIAKERLRIIVAQERSSRGAPDYLPLLQRELLEVIRKYVSIDAEAVKVDLVKDGEHDVLDISVALPEDRPSTA